MTSAEEVVAYETDWMQTGSEVEAMRRAVARAGNPLAPPDNWIDTLSPFSEQRLQQDQTASQHVAGAR
jgi:hypothetical protein